MGNSDFSLSDKLKAAVSAYHAGELAVAKRTYQEILTKFPANQKAKSGLKLVESKFAQSSTLFFDENALSNPLENARLGRVSGIQDPMAISKEAVRAASAGAKPVNLLGAAAGENTRDLKISNKITAKEYFTKGFQAYQEKKYLRAIELYENAIEVGFDYLPAHIGLGLALMEAKRFHKSIQVFTEILRRDPTHSDALINLSKCYTETGDYTKAVKYGKLAVKFYPKYPLALCNLAVLYNMTGEKDEAIACLRDSIDSDPHYTKAFAELANAVRFSEGDPLIAQMLSLLKTENFNLAESSKLNFALGKAFSDFGATEKSFFHYARANAQAYEARQFDQKIQKSILTFMQDQFTTSTPPKLSITDINDFSITPIFVVGMPRSGSTLVEQVISNHSLVTGMGEIPDFSHIMAKVIRRVTDGGVPIDKDILLEVRQRYLGGLKQLADGKKIVTDKNLLNFRFIGVIAAAFPEAKIIHLNRNPMAVCWSNFKHDFVGDALSFSFNLTDLGEYFNMYLDLMDFWRNLLPNRIYDLDYEAFTRDQEGETRKLIAHCGLGFEDSCLNFHKSTRLVKTASRMQVRKPVYQGSSKEWEKYRPHLK